MGSSGALFRISVTKETVARNENQQVNPLHLFSTQSFEMEWLSGELPSGEIFSQMSNRTNLLTTYHYLFFHAYVGYI